MNIEELINFLNTYPKDSKVKGKIFVRIPTIGDFSRPGEPSVDII